MSCGKTQLLWKNYEYDYVAHYQQDVRTYIGTLGMHMLNRVMKPSTYTMHAKLIQISVQMVVLHIALPTALPAAHCLSSPLPALPSSRCEVGHQFHSHGTAIFQQAATYDLSHLIYLSQSHPRWLTLHVNVFQSASIEFQECDLGLQSHLQDKQRLVTINLNDSK